MVTSAGIMFYARTQRGPLILLGQECYVKGWNDSHKWSDFGGRRKFQQETPEEIASREAWEETGGIIFERDDLLTRLHEQRFACYYDHVIDDDKTYRMYIVEIPYSDFPNLFGRVRYFMSEHKIDVCKVLEKEQMRWFTVQQLEESLGINLKQKTRFSRPAKLRLRFYNILRNNWSEIIDLLNAPRELRTRN